MGESMVTRQLELSDRRYWATAATLAALPGLIALINLVVSAYRIWIPSGTSQHDAFAYIGQCAVFILPSVILAPALLLGRLRVAAIWGLGVLMSSAFLAPYFPLYQSSQAFNEWFAVHLWLVPAFLLAAAEQLGRGRVIAFAKRNRMLVTVLTAVALVLVLVRSSADVRALLFLLLMLGAFALWIQIAVWTARAAERKGRNFSSFVWLALFFPIVCWIGIAFLPSVERQ